MEREIAFTVNGTRHELEVPIRLLLVDLLRDRLGLTGTHVGCSVEGRCGACTVLVDGKATKSCLMLAVQADGASVTTVEGLGDSSDELSPVQVAFRERHALQCGYCTPGLLMTATDFLSRTADPSDDEIRAAIVGNLCRCTGYYHIVDAIRDAAGAVPAGKE
jgi:carbon-monoxide dehydrogenase small subunit